MARLKYAVTVGGVNYPAGLTATPELRELINDRHWTGADSDQGHDTSSDVVTEEELAELRAMVATELEKRDTRITELETDVTHRDERIADLEAQLAAIGSDPKTITPATQVDYLSWSKKQLEDEVSNRNADRDPDGYLHVEPPGNKPELAAALLVDDNRTIV